MRKLSMAYISSFCLSLHLAAASGIPLCEGVLLFLHDEPDPRVKPALMDIYHTLECGSPLNQALRSCGLFPEYMTDMVEAGECTGRLDDVLASLSAYYDRQQRLNHAIRSAVVYPSVLLTIILAVIVLFIVKILPIFEDVYGQLGAVMSGPAIVMLEIGKWLGGHAAPLFIVLAAALCTLAWFLSDAGRRQAAGRRVCRLLGGRDLARFLSGARFSSIMSMALSSGMDIEDSLMMTARLADDDDLKIKLSHCTAHLEAGENFIPAVTASDILPSLYMQMLSVGIRTGSADTVMAEIARRSQAEAERHIDTALCRVEPALVVLMSLLVGLILLTVMLPLTSIMSVL